MEPVASPADNGLVQFLDSLIGVARVVGAVAAVALLLVAGLRGSRRFRLGVLLALVVGLTVAQPFGVQAVPVNGVPHGARRVDQRTEHSIDVVGVPLFRFEFYARRLFYLDDPPHGGPPYALRIRSWAWPAELTNATTVTEPNTGYGVGCLSPEDRAFGDPRPLPGYPCQEGGLELWRAADGDWFVRALVRNTRTRPATPKVVQTWRLETGIVSLFGTIYWLVAAAAGLGVALRRRRLRARAGPAAMAGVA
jgi:hypothetical protein